MSSILNVPNLQIFDNAAFVPFQPLNPNTCRNPSKENITPSPSSVKKQQKPKPADIDAEISEIEAQINLLTRKLQSLKTKKAQLALLTSKTPNPSRRSSIGRVVPAKFLNKIEAATPTPSKKPEEARRRGLSLGPAEIYHKAGTPFTTRKPPGFLKLEGIREEKQGITGASTISARRRGMSLGPSEISKSVKVAELRKGAATVGPKKSAAKRDIQESMSGVLRPKALFEDKKRPNASAKVRVVASRYNSSGDVGDGNNKRRKWSLPEEKEEEEEKRRMRTLSLGGGNLSRSLSPIMKIADGLPRIRTERRMVESPRDSGCAKRVAELAGRRSCFAQDDDGTCQSLKFEDDQCVFES